MTIERYRQYKRVLRATPFRGKNMPYDWGDLPNPLFMTWLAYSQMFDEFSIELANVVNALTRYTHQLAAWRDLIEPMSQQDQFDTAVEFIDPIATVAINLPYVIRSRFIFATAHLCHQANSSKQLAAWKDEFPLDTEVFFDAADEYGRDWRRYNALKRALEKVGAKGYQADTLDFRNAYNHRFSPRIVLGLTQVVQRHVDDQDGSISYAFGGKPALTLPHVVSLLEEQCQRCYKAFETFKALIKEHVAAITIHNAASLAAMSDREPTLS